VLYDYDYIIAGGGCAGLSLVYHLLQSELKDKRVLVVDKTPKLRNDKTWCFWTSEDPIYQSARKTHWRKMAFHSDQVNRVQNLAPLKYYCVNSLDFYNEIGELLTSHANVDRIIADVVEMDASESGAYVETTKGTFTAQWIFSSIPDTPELAPHHMMLKQHFCGWVVETPENVFQSDLIHLMDFSIKQQGDTRFMYILPFSPKRALIEFTVFSKEVLSQRAYYETLHRYINDHLGLTDYWIDNEEFGVIPMTNYEFPRQRGMRIIYIGTAGGFTKPSTGYTFLRIQEDCRRIVQQLITHQTPIYSPKTPKRFSFYDTLLLHIIAHRGHLLKEIFTKLFTRNDFRSILKFLDEKTHLWEDIWIIGRLPWKPFLRALYEYYLLKTWKRQSTDSNNTSQKTKEIEYTV